MVAKELGFDGNPGGASGGVPRGDGAGEVVGDRAEDPGFDDAIHARPIRIGGNWFVEEDVFLEGEFPNGKKELVAPTSVAAGGDVKDDGDQTPDVLHRHSLRMEVHNGGGLLKQ